jgi:hypothetical protein
MQRRGLKLPISAGAEHPQKFHSKRFVLAAAPCARVSVCVRPQLSSEMRRSAVPRRRQGARRGPEGNAAAARRPRDCRGCSGSSRRARCCKYIRASHRSAAHGGARPLSRSLHRPNRSMQPPSPRHPRPTNQPCLRLRPAQSAPSFEFMQHL